MPGSEGTTDHFPSTHATWLAERVTLSLDPGASPARARAARDELNAHVMSRYFEPLCAYVRGTGFRGVDEAADLVNGFFASRLARPDYLMQWRESGMELRRWLMNGLLLHLHERVRGEQRQSRRAQARDPADIDGMSGQPGHDPDAVQSMDRAWAESIVAAAIRETMQALESADRAAAWRAFRRHFVEGVAYTALSQETGASVRELKAQVELVQRWLRAGIERALQQDGVAAEAIEAETDRLVAMLLG